MADIYHFEWPTEPPAESMRLCDGCATGGADLEKYIAPMKCFSMSFDQCDVPKEQQVGIHTVEPVLYTRRELGAGFDRSTGETIGRQEGVAPLICSDLDRVVLLQRDWDEIYQAGCPGPEMGRKGLGVIGRRKAVCGLVRLMREASIK